jgi:hypothetical protein
MPRNKKGGSEEPPFSEEDFYKIFGPGPIAFTRPASPVKPRQQQEEEQREDPPLPSS